jgi:putative ABC transport system permease protein
MKSSVPRLFRLLLLLYPPRFRRRFGTEMLDMLEARAGRRRARGEAGSAARDIWFVVRDTARGLWTAYTETFLTLLRIRGGVRLSRRLSLVERSKLALGDLRLAIRSLRRTPGFAVVAVTTLALGIGANTAMFSVVNGIILRSLPLPEPDRLTMISATDLESGETGGSMSQPDLRTIQADSRTIVAAAGYHTPTVTLTGANEPTLVRAARVTDGLLDVIQAPPILGRDILTEENIPDGPRVVVISNALWAELFGSDPQVVGRRLEINEDMYQIVGVAPAGIDFPGGAQLWIPQYLNTEGCGRDCHFLRVIGRLAPGATLADARSELAALAARLEDAYPESNYRNGFGVELLSETVYGDVKSGLLILLGSVGLVLLIACANVANLLLVRGASRAGEMAVRAALGASRGRLVSQLLCEAFLLALLGGGAGIVLAKLSLPLLVNLAPSTLPRTDEIGLDGTVLLFASGAVLLVTLAFGLIPALRISGVSLSGALSRAGRGDPGGHTQDRSRSALLAAEVALSLLLLTGTGLLLKSFSEMSAVRLGFDKRDVVQFTLSLPRARYGEVEQQIRFYQDLQERLEMLPQVESVGSAYGSPMGHVTINTSTVLLDRPAPLPGREETNWVRVVTPGYLETLEIPLVRGRLFERSDNQDAQRVAIVSQSFAEKYFEDGDPIGTQMDVGMSMGMDETSRTIIGVVGDIRSRRLTREAQPEVYVPHAQMAGGYMTVLARMVPGTRNALAIVRREVRDADPKLALRDLEMLEDAVSRSVGPATFYLTLLAAFAGIAVALAVVGLYGVVSYLVSRRRREIGIRIALGAKRADVVRLVLFQGAGPVAIGVALGLIGSYWGTRLLTSLLYNVSPQDSGTLAITTVTLLGVASLAILLPARRASRVAPTEALRAE